MKRQKLIGYSIGMVGVVGLVGTLLFTTQAYRASSTKDEETEFQAQETTLVEAQLPIGYIGLDGGYWEYTEVNDDTEYDERQALLDDGSVTLWREFSEDSLMWFSAHYPGTFSYIGENLRVGDTVVVTTPPEYDGRHLYADPDVLEFRIEERVTTDIWAEEVIETIEQRATDVYNDGLDESSIVIQHSGDEEDSVILYFGVRVED